MTGRVFALTVVLTENIREDDVQQLVDAISLMRCVLRVSTHVDDVNIHSAEERARRRLIDEIWGVLKIR